MRHLPRTICRLARISALVCLLTLALGCLPDRRPVGSDAGGGAGNVDIAVDAGGDSEGGDSAQVDGDSDQPDIPIIEGCKYDEDCEKLAKNPCHAVTCNTQTGYCDVIDREDGSGCGDDDSCRSKLQCKGGFCGWQAKVCNDDNPCTGDFCDPSFGCSHPELEDAKCDDGNPCTENDACKVGECAGSKFFPSAKCPDDGNKCTLSACLPEKGCHFQFIEMATGATVDCDDGNACTQPDICSKGNCIAVGAKKCPEVDGNPCTLAGCHPKLGCGEAPIAGMKCDDSNPCTKDEFCQPKGEGGDPSDPSSLVECKGTTDTCDDDNPCTDDICVSAQDGKCQNAPADDGGKCDDGDICTDDGACKAGQCGAGGKKGCDDGNACTTDSCDGDKGGCFHLADDQAMCNDGDPCTVGEACLLGLCKPPGAAKCDDNNPCTEDVCGSSGCSNGLAKVASACAGGKCWWGQCLAPKCGNDACEPGEDGAGCAADCPAEGGVCGAADASCIATCQGVRCKAVDGACAADAGCLALKSCASDCVTAACRLGCADKANAEATSLFTALESCRAAACIKNQWSGQVCGAGAAQADCLSACAAAACWQLNVSCQGSAECVGVGECLGKCKSDVTCETNCAVGVPGKALAAYTAFNACRTKLCL